MKLLAQKNGNIYSLQQSSLLLRRNKSHKQTQQYSHLASIESLFLIYRRARQIIAVTRNIRRKKRKWTYDRTPSTKNELKAIQKTNHPKQPKSQVNSLSDVESSMAGNFRRVQGNISSCTEMIQDRSSHRTHQRSIEVNLGPLNALKWYFDVLSLRCLAFPCFSKKTKLLSLLCLHSKWYRPRVRWFVPLVSATGSKCDRCTLRERVVKTFELNVYNPSVTLLLSDSNFFCLTAWIASNFAPRWRNLLELLLGIIPRSNAFCPTACIAHHFAPLKDLILQHLLHFTAS